MVREGKLQCLDLSVFTALNVFFSQTKDGLRILFLFFYFFPVVATPNLFRLITFRPASFAFQLPSETVEADG